MVIGPAARSDLNVWSAAEVGAVGAPAALDGVYAVLIVKFTMVTLGTSLAPPSGFGLATAPSLATSALIVTASSRFNL